MFLAEIGPWKDALDLLAGETLVRTIPCTRGAYDGGWGLNKTADRGMNWGNGVTLYSWLLLFLFLSLGYKMPSLIHYCGWERWSHSLPVLNRAKPGPRGMFGLYTQFWTILAKDGVLWSRSGPLTKGPWLWQSVHEETVSCMSRGG